MLDFVRVGVDTVSGNIPSEVNPKHGNENNQRCAKFHLLKQAQMMRTFQSDVSDLVQLLFFCFFFSNFQQM